MNLGFQCRFAEKIESLMLAMVDSKLKAHSSKLKADSDLKVALNFESEI
ncbi:hypothetical protein [Pricia antarctica]|nr:hypothetical protein [Pricia antarctica]